MDAQASGRALAAANDLRELLQLAESAASRLAGEVHGVSYEHVALVMRELSRLRRNADQIELQVEKEVSPA